VFAEVLAVDLAEIDLVASLRQMGIHFLFRPSECCWEAGKGLAPAECSWDRSGSEWSEHLVRRLEDRTLVRLICRWIQMGGTNRAG